jgi:HSP20 family protein
MWNELLSESTTLFDEFDRVRRELDRLFEPFGGPADLRSAGRGAFPTVNIANEEDTVHVLVFAPGLASDGFDVTVQGNLLTITGKRELADPGEKSQAWVSERFNGEFRRTLGLPDDVDPNRVDAQYRDGVLWIKLQRHENARPRKIQIH